MINIHTCTIGYPNLIIAIIALMHGQFLQLVNDVISSTRVKVQIWIGTSIWACHRSKAVVRDLVFIKVIPTYVGGVTHFETHMTLGVCRCVLHRQDTGWSRSHISILRWSYEL
jgi:hypothetical protein